MTVKRFMAAATAGLVVLLLAGAAHAGWWEDVNEADTVTLDELTTRTTPASSPAST